MKPQNKLQACVYAISQALPAITAKQKAWAFKHCLKHTAYRSKSKTACLDCGHEWPSKDNTLLIVNLVDKQCTCPGCGETLEIEDTRKKVTAQLEYMAILDTEDGFQINRFFELRSYHKAGKKAKMSIREVVQQYLQPDGKNEVVARNYGGMGHGSPTFHGDLEIKDKRHLPNKFNVYPTGVYPDIDCLPVYRRNGFEGELYGASPYDLFTELLHDSKAETLLKARQGALLRTRVSSNKASAIYTHWDSIKICMRNGYYPVSGSIYLDYLALLSYFGKDLRSPKYVCPADLKAEHDLLVALKQQREAMARQKLEAKTIAEQESNYKKAKSKFFGIIITDKKLSINVLESVQEFLDEAVAHHHCIFTNRYFEKEDSLILSAKMDGKPIETIEISLSKMRIEQSRGLQNKTTEYHDEIVKLIKDNMHLIERMKKSRKPKKAKNQIAA